MSNPQKLMEIKGADWLKGISIQDTFPIGGTFQSSSYNFDPFDLMGYFRTALTPVQIDNTKVLEVMNSCVYAFDGVGYIVFMGTRTGTSVKNLYRITASTQAVTDYSVTGGSGTGTRNLAGLGFYKGRVLFADLDSASIFSLVISGIGTETALLSPSGYSSTEPTVFHNAPDGNCYFCRGAANGQVGRIDTVTGAGTNTGSAFTGDTSLTPKDMTSDGRYEIIIMDDNPLRTTGITSNCKVYFWDMDKADADIVLTIPDAYLISARWVDGRLLVIGASGIWQCGIGTAPRLIFPLVATELPTNPYFVTVQNNIMYWASASSGAKIYAYGAKIGTPILFAPFQTTGSDNLHTTLISSGTSFYAGLTAGTNTTKIYIHNTGSTRTNASVTTVPLQLAQPWKFSYAKVVLKDVLSSGQAIALTINNGAGTSILPVTTKQFSVDGAKKTFIFQPAGGTIREFEDISVIVNPQGGAVVQRVCIYGTPIDEPSQTI